MENIDISNIIEIMEIRKLIKHKKELLIFFDVMIEKLNLQVNEFIEDD
tara:strand:+ start:368 stop:511 length:144 start_codon:yes stop_codon:yes gene_type:complete